MTIKPIKTLKNQYRGINAHLHSQLQNHGWEGFHTHHLSQLTIAFRKQFHSMGSGYTAEIEQSLQIKRGGEKARFPESDITIFDTDSVRAKSGQLPAVQAATAEMVMPVKTLYAITDTDIAYYRAIGLYKIEPDTRQRDETPVAWVELLSPTNKPGGRHFREYAEKRLQLLQSGLVFVELDYQHEQSPAVSGVANYRIFAPGSHPYRITVTDPRPDFETATGRIREFDVDSPIPAMKIPLHGDDILDFDFNAPYQRTFEEVLYGDEVDYAEFPLNFERYSDIDRLRILLRMLTLMDAVQQKIPLDEPLPLKFTDLSLEEARHKFQALTVA